MYRQLFLTPTKTTRYDPLRNEEEPFTPRTGPLALLSNGFGRGGAKIGPITDCLIGVPFPRFPYRTESVQFDRPFVRFG